MIEKLKLFEFEESKLEFGYQYGNQLHKFPLMAVKNPFRGDVLQFRVSILVTLKITEGITKLLDFVRFRVEINHIKKLSQLY